MSTFEAQLINYEILNTLSVYTTEDSEQNIRKLFKIARDYYPDNQRKGLIELSTVNHTKVNDLIQPKILELLEKKQISFTDIDYIEGNECSKLHHTLVKDNYKFLDYIIANNLINTLKKSIDENRISNVNREDLILVNAILTKNSNDVEKRINQGSKLNNHMSTLLLTLYSNNNTNIFNLAQIIPILPKNPVNNLDNTALHLSVAKEDYNAVQALLTHNKTDINIQDKDGNTALHLAVKKNNHAIIQTLLNDNKIDVNIKNKYGYTALHLATTQKNHVIVQTLLDNNKIDVNIKDNNNKTALHWAVRQECNTITKILADHDKTNVNTQDSYGDTALHLAVRTGNTTNIKPLLERKDTKTDIKDMEGHTPLYLAQKKNYNNIVKLILEYEKQQSNTKSENTYQILNKKKKNIT